MKKKKQNPFIYATILLAMGLASCANSTTTTEQQLSQIVVGADRDAHGCIGSAGYLWSELVGDCIRPFEQGICMPATNRTSTSAAYILVSEDSSRIELFLPIEEKVPLLTRKAAPWHHIWGEGHAHDKILVERTDNGWCVRIDGKVEYKTVK